MGLAAGAAHEPGAAGRVVAVHAGGPRRNKSRAGRPDVHVVQGDVTARIVDATPLGSATGNAVGLEVVAVCVALGIGTLVERSALVFTVAKLAGAGYLIWLGIRAVRQRRGLASAFTHAPAPRRHQTP